MDAERALAELELRCFGDSAWSLSQLHSELHRPGSIHPMVHDSGSKELIAAALGWVVEDEAELLRISVLPERRREGLGRRLLEEFLSQARLEGGRSCFLEVRADNHAAIGLYRDCGFRQVDARKGYYQDGVDALVMQRRLPQ